MVASVRSKNLFSLVPHRVTVRNDLKIGLHVVEKCQGSMSVSPVPEQRHRFADDIPGRAERRVGSGRFRHKGARPRMVRVFRIEAGIEE